MYHKAVYTGKMISSLKNKVYKPDELKNYILIVKLSSCSWCTIECAQICSADDKFGPVLWMSSTEFLGCIARDKIYICLIQTQRKQIMDEF